MLLTWIEQPFANCTLTAYRPPGMAREYSKLKGIGAPGVGPPGARVRFASVEPIAQEPVQPLPKPHTEADGGWMPLPLKNKATPARFIVFNFALGLEVGQTTWIWVISRATGAVLVRPTEKLEVPKEMAP